MKLHLFPVRDVAGNRRHGSWSCVQSVRRAASRLLCAAMSIAAAHAVLAAPADLDPTFLGNIGAGITGPNFPDTVPPGAVQALGVLPNGKILVGGGHSRFNNSGAVTALKRLNADGTLDASFAPNSAWENGPHQASVNDASEVNAILVNPDGSFYIGGVFSRYGAESSIRWLIARVKADGTTDTTFNPPALNQFGFNRFVQTIALQADGKILVGGGFTVGGKGNLVRLDPDTGALDNSFDAVDLNSTACIVDSVSVAADGRIYVSGQAANKPFVYRLFANGSRDFGFNPPMGDDFGRINRVLALPDGRVLVGGTLSFAAPYENHQFLACLTESGAVDATFQNNLGTGPNGWVGGALKLMPDGRILASGIFNEVNGQPIASIMILNQNGTRDATFTALPYDNDRATYVTHFYDAEVLPNGKIVAGGWFDHVTDPGLDIRNLVQFQGYPGLGAGTIRLSSTSYVAAENAGVVRVPVVRLPGLANTVGVSYSVGGGTAVAGVDYTAVSGTLVWQATLGGVRYIEIPVLTDGVADGDKTVNITLNSTVGGATRGSPSVATLVIRDVDAAPLITAHPQGGTVDQGDSFAFQVGISSPIPVTFKWQRDTGSGFEDIPGATGLGFSIAATEPELHSGAYRVVVQSANGSVISNPAILNVMIPGGTVLPFNLPGLNIGNIQAATIDSEDRVVLLGTTAAVRVLPNGTVDPSFTLSYNSTPTGIIALDDGRYLISGFFTTVNGATIRGVARINSNGSLDNTFNLNLSFSVQAIALGAGGRIYVGPTAASGNGLRRFNANGTLDNTFNTVNIGTGVSNGYVWKVKELPDGKVLVGHQVQSGLSTTYRFDRLTSTGAVDPSFNALTLTGGAVRSIEVLQDGRILVGGVFTTIGSHSIQRLAMLDGDGNVDTTFALAELPNSTVMGTLYDEGRLVVWGEFTQIGIRAIRGLARFHLNGTVDERFKIGEGANGSVRALLKMPDGNYLVAGDFTTLKSQPRNRVGLVYSGWPVAAILESSTTIIEANTTVTLNVRRFGSGQGAVSLDYLTVDGTAVAGVDYQSASGTLTWADGDLVDKSIQIQVLNNALVQDTRTFSVVLTNVVGEIEAGSSEVVHILDDDTLPVITAHPEGTRIYEKESFRVSVQVNSPTPVSYQWRLNGVAISGATESSYNVSGALVGDDGDYTVEVTNAAGTIESDPAEVIILPEPTRIDSSFAFTATLNVRPNVLLPLPDGHVLAGGNFSTVNGSSTQRYLIRVDAAGQLDGNFTAIPNGEVKALVRMPDGSVIVGGNFTQIGGVNSARVARILPDGSVDTVFASNVGAGADQIVNALAVTPEGRIVAGGNFTTFNGSGAGKYVTILNPDGTREPLFVSQSDGAVTSITVQPDGRILLGGTFTYQGAVRNVRIFPNGMRDYTYASSVVVSSSVINRILLLADGRIILVGANMGSPASSGLMAVNPDGSSIRNITGGVHMDAHQFVNGQILTLLQNSPYLVLRNLDSTFTTDNEFNNTIGFNNAVSAMAVDHEGGIWVAGDFTQFRGETVNRIIRLHGKVVDVNILQQPADTAVPEGQTLSVEVEAHSMGGPLSYQWFKGGQPLSNGGRISGADTASLSISGMTEDDEGEYHVVVSNAYATVTSKTANVWLLGAPKILSQPETSISLLEGQNFAMEAKVIAAEPATYTWTRNGEAVSNGGRISGAGTARLVVTEAQAGDSGTYVLTVSNSGGSASIAPVSVTLVVPPANRAAGFGSLASSGAVNSILALPGGRVLIGNGSGNTTGGTGNTSSTSRLVLVEPDGAIQTPIANFTSGAVSNLVLQPDGKVLIFGSFTNIHGVARPGFARLNPDLSLDRTFNPEEPPLSVSEIAVDSRNRILIAGSFNPYPGTSLRGLVRLRPDGRVDETFVHSLGAAVGRVIVLEGDKYLVGGTSGSLFTGNRAAGVLNEDGSVAVTFPVNAIYSMAVDAQERVYFGINSAPRVVRYSADGVIDSAFSTAITSAGINSTVERILVQDNGRLVLVGGFTTPRNRVLRLEESGSNDLLFEPGTGLGNTSIYATALDVYGHIWLGGTFTTYNSATATRLVVLHGEQPDLSIVTPPAPSAVEPGETATFTVAAIGSEPINYQWYRNNSALSDGANISGSDSATLSISNASAPDDGQYHVVVSNARGQRTTLPVHLDVLGAPVIRNVPEGGLFQVAVERAFGPTVVGAAPLTIQWYRDDVLLTDDADYAGTTTSTLIVRDPREHHSGNYRLVVSNSLGSREISIPAQFYRIPAKIDPDTPALASLSSYPYAVVFLSDGTRVLGGNFTTIGWTGGSSSRQGIAFIRPNGTVDTTAPVLRQGTTTSSLGGVRTMVLDNQNRIYVGGVFTYVNGAGDNNQPMNRLVRLFYNEDNEQWERDPSFNIGTGAASDVRTLVVDGQGRLLVGGNFTSFNGNSSVKYICRLNSDGSLDDTFSAPDVTASVSQIILLPNGKFYSIGSKVLLHNADGSTDNSFNASGIVGSRAVVMPDGKLVVAVSSFPYLRRLNTDGSMDTSFPNTTNLNPIQSGNVSVITLQDDGKLLLGGSFTAYDGVQMNNMARLMPDGALDASFNIGSGFNGQPNFIEVDNNGRIHVGGLFSTFRGQSVPQYVVLNGDSPVTPPEVEEGFATWAAQFNLPEGQDGPNDDASGDGIPNIVVYALGGSPLENNTDRLPTVVDVLHNGEIYPGVQFTRNKNAVGVTFDYKASTDADFSTSADFIETVEDLGNGVERVTLRAAEPLSSVTTFFFDVKVVGAE